MIAEIKKHLTLQKEYFKVAVQTAMEYKVNFFTQVISMMLNDVFWIILWAMLFVTIKDIRGWNFQDVIMLEVMMCFAYGTAGFIFGNWSKISKIIIEGRLDFYLTLPKNPLYHLLISNSSFYDLGDILFAFILTAIFIPIIKWPIVLMFAISGTIIFVAFGVLVGALTFYFGNMEETSRNAVMSMLSFGMYPWSIFTGTTKFILLTLIPAGFIAGIPVELIKSFNWEWTLITLGFAVLITIVAIIVFNVGLKRYESGNLMYVRT